MGGLCLALALLVDGRVIPILALIPYPVLGALLAFVGVQHGLLARRIHGWEEIFVVLTIGVVGFVTGNLALGFGVGIAGQQASRLARHLQLNRYDIHPGDAV